MTPDKNQWWTEKTEKWIYKWECRKKKELSRTEKVRLKIEKSHSKYFIKILFSTEINYRFKVLYEVSQR